MASSTGPEFRVTLRFSDGGSQRVTVKMQPGTHRARSSVTVFDILEEALDQTGIDEGHVIGFKADLYRDGYKVT